MTPSRWAAAAASIVTAQTRGPASPVGASERKTNSATPVQRGSSARLNASLIARWRRLMTSAAEAPTTWAAKRCTGRREEEPEREPDLGQRERVRLLAEVEVHREHLCDIEGGRKLPPGERQARQEPLVLERAEVHGPHDDVRGRDCGDEQPDATGPLEEAPQGEAVHLGYHSHVSAGVQCRVLVMERIGARGVPRKGKAHSVADRALHSVEGSCRRVDDSPFLGTPGSSSPSTVSPQRGRRPLREEREMGICGTRKRAIARNVVTALVATVVFTLFVGVSWGGTYSPDSDAYSMANVTLGTGAQAWWNAGYTGKGVDVAVIDSGVAPVAGLNAPGKLVNGPDLSLDSQNSSLRYLDAYGHGTFMAGLIAGQRFDALTAAWLRTRASSR